MPDRIRRKFIKNPSLERLEKELNDFTDKYNPADILDVQFFCLTETLKMAADERGSETGSTEHGGKKEFIKHSNEFQTHEDRYIVMIVYLETETKKIISG